MAQAKQTSRLFGAVAGAAMTAAAVFAPAAASAQEVIPAAQTTESVWTDELRALRKASDDAQDYAENHFGVGILIHVGDDFPNEYFEKPEDAAQAFIDLFEGKFNIPSRAFFSPNPGSQSTGITFHIGNQIHGAENGTEVKLVGQAVQSMPDVVEQLRIIKEIQPTLEVGQLTLSNGG